MKGAVDLLRTGLDPELRQAYAEYERRVLRFSSEATRKHYRIQLRHLARFSLARFGRPAGLADFNDETILDAMADLQRSRSQSPYTTNKFRACILAMWRHWARKHVVPEFPEVQRLVEPDLVPIGRTREELDRMFAACQRQTGCIGPVPADTWWLGLKGTIWWSAERIGAVMRIDRHGDVDYETGRIVFPAAIRKGGKMFNVAHVDAETLACLREIRRILDEAGVEDPALFHFPKDISRLWPMHEKLLRDAGLPVGRWFHFHCDRKAVASHAKVAGLDPTKLLCHSDPKLFDRHYNDRRITEADQPQLRDVLFRPGEAG